MRDVDPGRVQPAGLSAARHAVDRVRRPLTTVCAGLLYPAMTTGSPASSGVDLVRRRRDARPSPRRRRWPGPSPGPCVAAARSSVSSSIAPAQCSAVSSPRLWPTAVDRLDAERREHPQPGHGGGHDARLRDLGGDQVAVAGQAQPARTARRPSRSGAAARRRRRVVRRPGQGTGSRCAARPRRRRGTGRPAGSSTERAPLSSRASSLVKRCLGLLRGPGHHRGADRPAGQCAGQRGGQVAEFGERELRRASRPAWRPARAVRPCSPRRAAAARRPDANGRADACPRSMSVAAPRRPRAPPRRAR